MKYLQFLKKLNIPAVGFLSFLGCFIFKENNASMAIAAFALSGLYGFKLYLDHVKKPDFSKEVKIELDQIKGAIQVIKIDKNIKSQENDKNKRYF